MRCRCANTQENCQTHIQESLHVPAPNVSHTSQPTPQPASAFVNDLDGETRHGFCSVLHFLYGFVGLCCKLVHLYNALSHLRQCLLPVTRHIFKRIADVAECLFERVYIELGLAGLLVDLGALTLSWAAVPAMRLDVVSLTA